MSSAGVVKAIAKVSLAEDQTGRYTVTVGGAGWMQYDPLARAWADGVLLTSIIPAGSTLQYGNKDAAGFIQIDRKYLKGLILRPLDTWVDSADAQANYTFDPNSQWDYQTSGDGLFTDLISTDTADGTGAMLAPWAEMDALANPFFTVRIKRAAPPQETIEAMRTAADFSEASWSCIYFGWRSGMSQWALYIPSQGKPQLYENVTMFGRPPGFTGNWPLVWVPRPWTEGELSEVSSNGMSGEGKTYRIGVIGPAICVSESTFDENFAYYCAGWYQGHSQPIVSAGPVRAESWPGGAVFDMTTCYFLPGVLWRYPWEAPNISMLPATTGYYVWGQAWIPGALPPGMVFGQLRTDAPYFFGYDLMVMPVSGLTPFVESVTVYQYPMLSDDTALVFTEITRRYEADGEEALGDSSASRWEVTVDNRLALEHEAISGEDSSSSSGASSGSSAAALAYPTALLRPGRIVEIRAGRQFTDGTTDLVDGSLPLMGHFYVVGPPRDSFRCRVSLTDLMGMLALIRWINGPVCGKGWYAKAFMEYILECAGIGDSQQGIEDLGVLLTNGIDAEQEKWLYEDGEPFADILRHLAKQAMHNGVVWYDGPADQIKTGCRYCRTARTAATWASHQDAGWNSTGCLAADATRTGGSGIDLIVPATDVGINASILEAPMLATALSANEPVLHENEYANLIRVRGKSLDGKPMEVSLRNDPALDAGNPVGTGYGPILGREFVGWPITKTEDVPDGCTYNDLLQRAYELAQDLFPWALCLDGLEIPYTPFLRPGHVIQIQGGQSMDVNLRKFRVTAVQPKIGECRLRLDAREMIAWSPTGGASSSSSSGGA